MSRLGFICLITSWFTNVTYSYVGLWLAIYALCLTAQCAPLLSNLPPITEWSHKECPAFLP